MKIASELSISPQKFRVLLALFFLSGASSLVFETIFTRLLTYTFGNTAHAVSTVLAAFLGGLALGAWLIGKWADRRAPSLWIYGFLELGVAAYCLFIPQLFRALTQIYVFTYHALHPGSAALTFVRFFLTLFVILPPALLMGGSLPALARYGAEKDGDVSRRVSRLYAWNTLGAASGVLSATYGMMPWLGIRGTITVACGINLLIFITVAAISFRPAKASEKHPEQPVVTSSQAETSAAQISRAPLLWIAFLTGAVALAYEVIWTHILAFLIGNTVYAFGTMLFTFLCGLAWGARMVSRRLRRPERWGSALAASQVLLGLSIFLTLPLWDRVPDVLALGLRRALDLERLSIAVLLLLRMVVVGWNIYRRPFAEKSSWRRILELVVEVLCLAGVMTLNVESLWTHETMNFVAVELLRFFCAFYLMVVPAVLLGVSFPLLLNFSSRGGAHIGARVGAVYAANTVGAILGSLAGGFAVLPAFGSYTTLLASATVNVVLGIGLGLWWVPVSLPRRLALAAAVSVFTILAWAGPSGWDARRMSRGSYVYFDAGWPVERVLYFKEDVQGGLTSVIEAGKSRILLSNGKFQGNNSGEVGAQVRFAMIPILFTRAFDRALVIGLGTGNTLRTVARFPFRTIDTVEIAPHIVEAARLWFEDVNERAFDRDPRVRLRVTDGRNFLLLAREPYDLITIEISSIWISGEADLYNREFYELCRARLKSHGVLQQWVQIHHMRPQDFLVILNTAAQVFPHVAFFLGPEQGLLIASASPLECDYSQIAEFESDPGVRRELAALGIPSLWTLLGELMVYDESFRNTVSLLPNLAQRPLDFVSEDFRPYLEYQTPKGNTVPYDTARLNVDLLLRFRPKLLPPDLALRNLPSEDERSLVLGYVAEARGDPVEALEFFRSVRGSAAPRAKEEISRLESGAHH